MTDLTQALRDFRKVSGGPYMSKQENQRLQQIQKRNRKEEEMHDKELTMRRMANSQMNWGNQTNRRGTQQNAPRGRDKVTDSCGLPLGAQLTKQMQSELQVEERKRQTPN